MNLYIENEIKGLKANNQNKKIELLFYLNPSFY